MNDLITYIDCQISECLGRGKFYGLARLVEDNKGEHYPIPDKVDTKMIAPSDKDAVLIYHRLLNGTGENSDVYSFGREFDKLITQSVRMVVVIDMKEGAELIDRIIDAMPDKISDVNYRFAEVGSSVVLIRDSQSVREAEWGNAYKDKFQQRSYVYAVEYSLEYIKCNECVPAN